ncbi:glycosyl transferase family 2 [Aeromonas caviae]|uniref:glycosyltransferase family 2 protein n=1 Tax=Aeromonas caviae TaxID=648 RepID=UPI001FC890AA|nr:glycosyltransferase family 2 protein [Aeromonas caviae]GKQ75879.1 glycosyl transferase family 2 [Aeromonas caviae]
MQSSNMFKENESPHVLILICTCNGDKFLEEQLISFEEQTYANWAVIASDDGSTDNTRTILEKYKNKWKENQLTIVEGPRQGVTKNFMSLICNKAIEADYYAFSDQDDIWIPSKLERALNWLQKIKRNTPALYCSSTLLVDENNNKTGLSTINKKAPSFSNALMQNIASGNTMVLNKAAIELLCQTGPDISIIIHDWWSYLVVTGCGGMVFYDSTPTVRYRQHTANLIGSNDSLRARILRMKKHFQGRLKSWNEIHIKALASIEPSLTAENQKRLADFAKIREDGLLSRLFYVKRSGIYRQTLAGNLSLLCAVLLKKL